MGPLVGCLASVSFEAIPGYAFVAVALAITLVGLGFAARDVLIEWGPPPWWRKGP